MHGVIRSAYLAPPGLEPTLAEALARAGAGPLHWHGRLALSVEPPVNCAWAQDTWTAPALYSVASVKAAADTLRAIQRNWTGYAAAHHRRTALIEARLPPVKAAPLVFPAPAPTAHLGAWTLLEPGLLLASPTTVSPVPNGAWRFTEDRTGPPSRAYLKLWEALTRLGAHPGPSDICLDLGAAPGGWTWVLARLGAQVTAVDKAPLDPATAALPGVTQRLDSAFALDPVPVDWLVCDVIAYPARTLDLLRRWWPIAGAVVCTLKFQGATDHDAAEAATALPGAKLVHLFHNKHELTVLRAPAFSPSSSPNTPGSPSAPRSAPC